MKLYIHYEADPAFTKVLRYPGGPGALTVADAVEAFVEAYNIKHPSSQLRSSQLKLLDEKARPLAPTRPLVKLSDGADIFVEHSGASGPPDASGAAARPVMQAAVSQQQPQEDTAVAPQSAARAQTRPAQQESPPQPQQAKHAVPKQEQQKKPPRGAQSAAASNLQQMAAFIKPHLDRASTATKSQNYRLAGELYDQVQCRDQISW